MFLRLLLVDNFYVIKNVKQSSFTPNNSKKDSVPSDELVTREYSIIRMYNKMKASEGPY